MWTFAHQVGQLVLTAVLLMSDSRLQRSRLRRKAPRSATSNFVERGFALENYSVCRIALYGARRRFRMVAYFAGGNW